MQNILRGAFALTVAAALTLTAGGAATAGSSPVLAAASATPSTCSYDGLVLSSITAAGPAVREQAAYRRHHQRQWVRYNASLQALSGTTWKAVPHSGRHKVKRLHTWTTRMPALTLAVPSAGGAGAYRVTTTIRWYRPDGRHVAKKQSLVLPSYSSGATSCLARKPAPTPKPAPGSQSLAVGPNRSLASTGQAFNGAFTATGLSGSESVAVTLYGPMTTKSGCTGPVASSSSVTASGSGTFTLPTVAEATSGYYYWGVSTAGNSRTVGASACASTAVTVRKPATVTVTTINRFFSKPITAEIAIGGTDRALASTWTGVLWGPFSTLSAANANNCTGSVHHTLVANRAITVQPGTTAKVTISPTGTYWQTSAYWRWSGVYYGNDLQTGKAVCSAVFHTLKTAP